MYTFWCFILIFGLVWCAPKDTFKRSTIEVNNDGKIEKYDNNQFINLFISQLKPNQKFRIFKLILTITTKVSKTAKSKKSICPNGKNEKKINMLKSPDVLGQRKKLPLSSLTFSLIFKKLLKQIMSKLRNLLPFNNLALRARQ